MEKRDEPAELKRKWKSQTFFFKSTGVAQRRRRRRPSATRRPPVADGAEDKKKLGNNLATIETSKKNEKKDQATKEKDREREREKTTKTTSFVVLAAVAAGSHVWPAACYFFPFYSLLYLFLRAYIFFSLFRRSESSPPATKTMRSAAAANHGHRTTRR